MLLAPAPSQVQLEKLNSEKMNLLREKSELQRQVRVAA